jgi:hypothetical protein
MLDGEDFACGGVDGKKVLVIDHLTFGLSLHPTGTPPFWLLTLIGEMPV